MDGARVSAFKWLVESNVPLHIYAYRSIYIKIYDPYIKIPEN